jgi:multiple sugar transport system substrate-binding protein
VSDEPDAKHAAMVANAKGRRGRRADVYILDVIWMTEFIARGYIKQLNQTGLSIDDFLPNLLRTCRDLHGGRGGLPSAGLAQSIDTGQGHVCVRLDRGA